MSFDLKMSSGDVVIDKDGTIGLVRGTDKLRQDIIKILLTKLGENNYHPSYGSALGAINIGHVSDSTFLNLELKSVVSESINNLILLQDQQSRRQVLSPSEVIVSIVDVVAEIDVVDPRLYHVFLSVMTQELTEVTESITVRII